jgi:hypothetical protein
MVQVGSNVADTTDTVAESSLLNSLILVIGGSSRLQTGLRTATGN